MAITNGPVTDYLADLRNLLKDKDETVRLKTALGLAGAKEQEAVPALIKLVGELPPEASGTAEEYLVRLAAATLPKGLPEGDDNRKKRSEVWSKWFDDNKQKLVMVDRTAPVRADRFYGYTVLVMPNNGMIMEWDKDKKERWKITGLAYPWDAQVLPGNKVLIAENNGMKVTERNFKGEILWEKRLQNGYPMSAESLEERPDVHRLRQHAGSGGQERSRDFQDRSAARHSLRPSSAQRQNHGDHQQQPLPDARYQRQGPQGRAVAQCGVQSE